MVNQGTRVKTVRCNNRYLRTTDKTVFSIMFRNNNKELIACLANQTTLRKKQKVKVQSPSNWLTVHLNTGKKVAST